VCSIEVREVGGRKVTVLDQKMDEDTSVATIVVRASTENVINDVERALDDGIQSVKTLFVDNRLLVGAGATELELNRQLLTYADEVLGLDQYAIRKFAEAFDVVPRTLAENSGHDATSTMYALHNSHVASADNSSPAHMGIELDEGKPFNAAAAGIFDLYATKFNALRLAVDAALTVLRVDQIVMSKPAGGPKPPPAGGGNDRDD
jgi:T-complex protein 1 subunit theta